MFNKRTIVYSKVINLKEIIYIEVIIKRSENANSRYRLKGSKITIEEELKSGKLEIENDKILVINKFND